MINSGDKVKYIGTKIPEYTNQILEVSRVISKGLIIVFPEKDRREVIFDGLDSWKCQSLICGFDEVEEVVEG